MAFGLLNSIIPDPGTVLNLYTGPTGKLTVGKITVNSKNYNPSRIQIGYKDGNNIRYFEEDKPYPKPDFDKITKNAKNLQKVFDNSRAISYINEQYRSVYKTKPGGLNDVLKRAEHRKR